MLQEAIREIEDKIMNATRNDLKGMVDSQSKMVGFDPEVTVGALCLMAARTKDFSKMGGPLNIIRRRCPYGKEPSIDSSPNG